SNRSPNPISRSYCAPWLTCRTPSWLSLIGAFRRRSGVTRGHMRRTIMADLQELEVRLGRTLAERDVSRWLNETLLDGAVKLHDDLARIADAMGLSVNDFYEPGADRIIAWIEGVKSMLPDDAFFADTGMLDN